MFAPVQAHETAQKTVKVLANTTILENSKDHRTDASWHYCVIGQSFKNQCFFRFLHHF